MITKTEIYILTNQSIILGALALLLPDTQADQLNEAAKNTQDYCEKELFKATGKQL